MTPLSAIVGRRNVGNSPLFTRLVGKKLALVDDRPGVTRDRREGEASLGDLTFRVVDTAGLEEATEESLLGLGAMKRGDYDGASRWFDQIAADRDTPQGLRGRLELYSSLVAGGPIQTTQ